MSETLPTPSPSLAAFAAWLVWVAEVPLNTEACRSASCMCGTQGQRSSDGRTLVEGHPVLWQLGQVQSSLTASTEVPRRQQGEASFCGTSEKRGLVGRAPPGRDTSQQPWAQNSHRPACPHSELQFPLLSVGRGWGHPRTFLSAMLECCDFPVARHAKAPWAGFGAGPHLCDLLSDLWQAAQFL